MNIKDLECFQEVYREKSMNKAAGKLYITPQGLGKMIQNLEQELHTVLFKRTPQGAIPTESAELLYEKSELLIREFEEIEYEIRQIEQQREVLRIGCACGIFHLLPLELILQFSKENTNIRVEWCEYTNDKVKELLDTSKIEYGFMVGDWEKENIKCRKLTGCGISLMVYEGHPLYDCKTVKLENLRQENVLMMNEHFHMYSEIMDACRMRGFSLNPTAKTADGSFLHKLCAQKAGVAIIPDFVEEQYRMDHLRLIPFEEQLTWNVYGAYKKNHEKYEVVRKFDHFLRNKVSAY